jgi:hypothetical protein
MLAHGYATAEFEVTAERLGCYLPTEHIDNPKGYAEGQDARRLDSRLRGPVDPQELQIDPRTGMKNYIANGEFTSNARLTIRTRSLGYLQRFGQEEIVGMYRLWKEVQEFWKQ